MTARVAEKIEVTMKSQQLDTRVALLEQSITNVNESLKRMEGKFERIDKRFDEVVSTIEKKHHELDAKIEKVKGEVSTVRSEGWSQMRWVIGFMIAFMSSPILTEVIKLIHVGK